MKINHFSYKFFILFILLFSTLNAADYTCNGETVTNINNTTVDASASYVTSGVNQTARYFQFKTNKDGEVTISQNNNKPVSGYYNHKLEVGTGSCGSSNIHAGSGTTSDSVTFELKAGQTIYVRVVENNYQNELNFDIDFNFVVKDIKDHICSNPRPFALRSNQVIAGDLIAIGNSNICADDDDDGECDDDQLKRNDTSNIIFINSTSSSQVDSSHSGLTNTSGSTLSLPTNATVIWAGLYWQGELWDMKDDTEYAKQPLANQVKFKTPGSSYQDLTADDYNYFFVKMNSGNSGDAIWRNKDRYEMHYQGFKDVTSLVDSAGEGEYWLANIQATTGKLWYPGVEAAWTLQVIYSDPAGQPRSISVSDGFYGLYSNGSAGDDYANEINGLYGSSCPTGGANTGAYDYSINFDITGFVTPVNTGFDTDFTVFVTESDPDGAQYNSSYPEQLSVTLNDGSRFYIDGPNANPSTTDAWAYAITNKDGSDNTNRTPNYNYPIGMTIKNYTKTDALDTNQTSTNIKFQTDGDRLIIGVIGFATDLRKPNLCYDYAYSQNTLYFTEENDGSNAPRIVGNVSNDDIDVKLFIKNKESDILAENMSVHILDINTSQATYVRDTTGVLYYGDVARTQIDDSSLNVSDSYIKNIPIGDLSNQEYFYTYYSLSPSVSSIDIPLNARVDYNITLPTGGTDITIPYQLYLNSDIEMCSNNSFNYTPAKGIFNVVHNKLYDKDVTGGTNQAYNLPTQVVGRVGNFKVISIDSNTTDGVDTLTPVSTMVSIEMIDLNAFNTTEISCGELNSSISEKIWVTFEDNATSTPFDNSLVPSSFYSQARQSASFRITYNAANSDGDLIGLSKTGDTWHLENFPDYGGTSCTNNENENVVTVCANNGVSESSGLDDEGLKACMECIYGLNTKYICSQDNFSIRPESFLIKIDDQNQTNPSTKLRLADNVSGNTSPITNRVDISAGYNYNVEINATSHVNGSNALGYLMSYASNITDRTFEYEWAPTTTPSSCNDTDNKFGSNNDFDMGSTIELNSSVSQVGEYTLRMRDTVWTQVDSDPSFMTHHIGSYFLSSATLDCVADSSVVRSDVTYPSSNYLNGCDISSSHTNVDTNVLYNDYNISVHPYKFDVSSITPTTGINNDPLTANGFIYMSDLNNTENMALHLNGDIVASGYDGTKLTNFTTSCYAKNVKLELINNVNTTLNPTYRYRYHNENNTPNDINGTLDITNNFITLPATNFRDDQNGSLSTKFHLNFERKTNVAVNPRRVTYGNYNISCSTPSECIFNADLGSKETEGNVTISQSINHLYGRTNSPRKIFPGQNGVSPIYFEVYCNEVGTDSYGVACNKALIPGADPKMTNDPRWFVNTQHSANDGVVGQIDQKNNSLKVTADTNPPIFGTPSTNVSLTYDEGSGYPYKATMENNASEWLIYNKYDANKDKNEFEVEFTNSGSSWGGVDDANSTSQTQENSKTNRRIMW